MQFRFAVNRQLLLFAFSGFVLAGLLWIAFATIDRTQPNRLAPDGAPHVFSMASEGSAGDLIWFQGGNFDPSLRVMLRAGEAAPAEIPILNRVFEMWVAVRLPQKLPEPVVFQLENKAGKSQLLPLNAARPYNLDTTIVVPGGVFRLLGRSLMAQGHTPKVLIEDQAAAIDMSASSDSMLVVTAPLKLRVGKKARIFVDNGNGTGPAELGRSVSVGEGSGDPLAIGAGWGAGFTFNNNVLTSTGVCDGKSDDTNSINDSIRSASGMGGGVVQLPEGTCLVTGTINLASRVVLRGAGRNKTVIRYQKNYPIYAKKLDLVGLLDIQLLNADGIEEGILWQENTRSVIQRVTINMGISRQLFLTENTNFVFDNNIVNQKGSYDQQSPYRFDGCSGLIFSRVHTTNVAGSPTFLRVHDSVIFANRFTRDASTQAEQQIVTHHGFVMNFAHRVELIDNIFDIINGPVTNKHRNDGEAIFVGNGEPLQPATFGKMGSADAGDFDGQIEAAAAGQFSEEYDVVVVSGRGFGQSRHIVSRAGSTFKIDRPWDIIPAPGSMYSASEWGLDKVVIRGNHLFGNPRGIWVYNSPIRDVTIADNEIRDGGGIFLRSFQSAATYMRTVQFAVSITGNYITNNAADWMSYIILSDVIADEKILGSGQWGIQIQNNRLSAQEPNVSSSVEDYASSEGFASVVHFENKYPIASDVPGIVGPIFQANTCEQCDRPFSVSSGVFGPILLDNIVQPRHDSLLTDVRIFGEQGSGAQGLAIAPAP